MERFNLNYSKKNIPVQSKNEYKIQLIAKTENLIKRMRWKALYFLGKLEQSNKNSYGFKSRKCPPVVEETVGFENDLMDMIKNVEFRNINNNFQTKLSEDMEKVKNCPQIIVSADKSRNMYLIDKPEYVKHLTDNISKTYKKGKSSDIDKINKGTFKIIKELGIDQRVERLQETDAYITVKDHKLDFENRPSFRLINPSKSDIGKISKNILDRLNFNTKAATSINQWRNTHNVINWFKNLPDKTQLKFVQFDIESFYPSISPELFKKSLDFAKQHSLISNTELEIIHQARKSLLFSEGQTWVKRNGSPDFDVPMGCFDGAEVCEMVGNFLLNKLLTTFEKENIGLYRDDGLGVLKCCSGPDTERKKKKIIKVFKENGLNITINTGLTIVDFLDVKFNLANSSFMPYRKPNDLPVYIHKESNHPPTIKKELPRMISKRVSELSSNEQIFNRACPMYEKALKDSGFEEKLEYTRPLPNSSNAENQAKVNRKRKIIWYNPPFSQSVKSNIGKKFLKLVLKHFPRNNSLHKIFNKNTIKISYSCMRNVSSIIASHNKKILSPEPPSRTCNCINKNNCPLQNKCLTQNVVYKAVVRNTSDDEIRNYAGMTQPIFKLRFSNHCRDANIARYKNSTELSKYIWSLKDDNKIPSVSYEVIYTVLGKSSNYFCRLCATEKLVIIENLDDNSFLNKRSEFISKCRHTNKYLLNPQKDSKD